MSIVFLTAGVLSCSLLGEDASVVISGVLKYEPIRAATGTEQTAVPQWTGVTGNEEKTFRYSIRPKDGASMTSGITIDQNSGTVTVSASTASQPMTDYVVRVSTEDVENYRATLTANISIGVTANISIGVFDKSITGVQLSNHGPIDAVTGNPTNRNYSRLGAIGCQCYLCHRTGTSQRSEH